MFEKIEVIVTRHPSLVTYLKEKGIAKEDAIFLQHTTVENIQDKHVAGVLPHSLSCLCKTFTEIPLDLPQKLRGKELSIEEIRKFAGEAATYRIIKIT